MYVIEFIKDNRSCIEKLSLSVLIMFNQSLINGSGPRLIRYKISSVMWMIIPDREILIPVGGVQNE